MGVRHREWPVEGVQFHPESILTTEGPLLIANWLRSVGVPDIEIPDGSAALAP